MYLQKGLIPILIGNSLNKNRKWNSMLKDSIKNGRFKRHIDSYLLTRIPENFSGSFLTHETKKISPNLSPNDDFLWDLLPHQIFYMKKKTVKLINLMPEANLLVMSTKLNQYNIFGNCLDCWFKVVVSKKRCIFIWVYITKYSCVRCRKLSWSGRTRTELRVHFCKLKYKWKSSIIFELNVSKL